jgi:hypothetical protein
VPLLGKPSSSKILKNKHESARRKASGGSRAGHSRVMPEPDLMSQFEDIVRLVIFLEF